MNTNRSGEKEKQPNELVRSQSFDNNLSSLLDVGRPATASDVFAIPGRPAVLESIPEIFVDDENNQIHCGLVCTPSRGPGNVVTEDDVSRRAEEGALRMEEIVFEM